MEWIKINQEIKINLTAILLCAVLGLCACIWLKWKKHLKYWNELGITCAEPHWLFGNVNGVAIKYSFFDIWIKYYERFKGTGPFAGFFWILNLGAFVLDPALAKNILIKDFANFTDRGFYSNEKDDPLTGHIFLLDGLRWKLMRTKMSPTFTTGKMKFMFPTIVKVGHEFVASLDDELLKSSVINVFELLGRFTTDVIGTCAFGIDCNSIKNPKAEFRDMATKAFGEQRNGKLGSLIINFPKLAGALRLKFTPQPVEDFYLRIVRETVAEREKHNIRRNDFMDMLIDLKNNKLMKDENSGELTNLTIEEMAAQAFAFLVAGFETSSTTISFALYELAQHQDVQQRARDEINTVLERHNDNFSYECMKEMKYLEQVISETLRLYSVLPVLNRVALNDYVVPGHPKYVIKKGMKVLIPIFAMHRDPEFYPNPNTFNPANFDPEVVKERDCMLYMPFGEGPRNCLGMRFAKMTVRVGLALLLKNYKFSVCAETQIPIKYNMIKYFATPASGVYLKVERILK